MTIESERAEVTDHLVKYQPNLSLQLPYSWSCIVLKPDPAIEYYEAYKTIGRKYTVLKRYDLAKPVIQAAIDIGRKVLIKAGEYTINDTINVSSSPLCLEGEGYENTIIKLGNGINKTVLYIPYPQNRFILSKLTIDGNKTNNTAGHGIHFHHTKWYPARALVKNIYVKYCKEHGIYLQGASGFIMDSIRIIECDGNGLVLEHSADNLFSNFIVASSGLSGVKLGTYTGHNHISNFHVWGAGMIGTADYDQAGIQIMGVENTVESSESEGNRRVSIYIEGKRNIVSGVLSYLKRVKEQTLFVPPWSENDPYTGILLRSPRAQYNIICNNVCLDLRRPVYQRYGIELDEGPSNNIIMNNDVSLSIAGMKISGTDNIIKFNKGFTTENSGTATLSAGTTSVEVAHALSVTPHVNKIKITPMDNLGGRSYWVEAHPANPQTCFLLKISSSDTVDHSFGWSYE